MQYFVISHRKVDTPLPAGARVIGVEGYVPEASGVAASSVITRALDDETALGALRALPVILDQLEKVAPEESVFVGTYRLFLGSETSADWLSPAMQENRCLSFDQVRAESADVICTKIPDDVDILIPSPRLLPDTILGQYMRVHILDDLLMAVGCAIRTGLLDPISVPYMLQSNTLIPYGNFAARAGFRKTFTAKVWDTVMEFYRHHYRPRAGYQRRVIDFAFERVISMALVQHITKEKLRCRACRNIWITPDGTYAPSL